MRVVLFTLNSKFIHSSLALRYLQAAVASDFPDTHLLEFQINDDPRGVLAELGRQQPDVLACSCYIWNIEQTLALVRDLRQVYPNLIVILGGPEAGARPAELLQQEPAVSYVVAGEGEGVLHKLLHALGGQVTAPIAGLYGRDRLAANCPPEHPLPVTAIPAPYQAPQLAQLGHKLVYFETSRGCPFGCAYCLSARDRSRFFPLEWVFEQLQVLLDADIPLIKFVDRTFNAQPERAVRIMEYLLAHRQSTRFHFEICADLLTEETLTFLETVPPGVFQFEIGIQSTQPATLAAIWRQMHWGKLAANVLRLKAQHNIHLHLDLIAGLPYQDLDGLAESFNQVMNLVPDQLQLGFLKILPGTPIVERVQEYGYAVSQRPPYEVLQTNWLSFQELNSLHVLEQLLESFYNSGLLQESLRYLWSAGGTQPWQLFRQLAKHWETGQLHRISLGQEALIDHFAAWAPPDAVLADCLTIDRARILPSYPATWRLPDHWRNPWEQYLNQHLEEFSPRTYKQAFRSIFPVPLGPAALAHYGRPPGQVAVVDRELKRVHGFVALVHEV